MLNPDAPKRWHFGRVALDERGSVTVAGAPVTLEFSGFRVLLALLRHAGEVVTKDELLEHAWPGRVVAENSLAKAISRLRQALGKDAEAIRAVYGYGYRLNASVRVQSLDVTPVLAADRLQPGDRMPLRADWYMARHLGRGATGDAVLARDTAGAMRVFKFAIGEMGLRGLRREVALSRYLAAALPKEAGLVPLLDWNLSLPPFFVEMPYYPEGNLREWGERDGRLRALSFAARLELCAQLCEVVAALHGAGVIHRDLKPENLYPVANAEAAHAWRLVLGDLGAGEAALSPQLAELGLTRSLVGSATETTSQGAGLLYLAPEIIAGEAASQSSDIYALGVLIYQILAADLRRPLGPGWEADIEDVLLREDIALAATVRRAQRVIDARGLACRLRRLDARRQAIVDARQRQAAAERQGLRLVLVERRRKLGLAALTLVSGLLAVAASLYLYADRARDRALRIVEEKQAVLDFFSDRLLAQADPYVAERGGVLLHDAMDAIAPLIESDFADQPGVALTLHGIVGDMYISMARYDAGVAHLEAALRQYARLRDAEDPRTPARFLTMICIASRAAGNYADAAQACARAHALLGENGFETTSVDLQQGILLYERGQCRAALESLKAVREHVSAKAGDANGEESESAISAGYFLALCLHELGLPDQAEREFLAAIQARRARNGEESPQLAWALSDYGLFLIDQGRLAQAEDILEKSRGIFVRNLDEYSPDRYQADYGLAILHLTREQWGQAIPLLQQVLEAEQASLGGSHLWSLMTLSDLALAQAGAGLRRQAAESLEKAVRKIEPRLDDHGTRASYFLDRWIDTALALGDGDRATGWIEAQSGLVQALEPAHPRAIALACHKAVLARVRSGMPVIAAARPAACSQRWPVTAGEQAIAPVALE